MSKIKLLVEIDEEDYGDFCDWFESVPSSVDGLPCVKGKFNTALYDAKPYDDSGDLISREALKANMKKAEEQADTFEMLIEFYEQIIDNAPLVEQSIKVVCRSRNWSTDCTVTSGFEDGYRHGYRKAKEDVAKRIKEQYNAHHELIPYWLSIGYLKGGAE